MYAIVEADSRCVLMSAAGTLVEECLPPAPRTCRWFVCCNGATNGPPTDRASLRLLHGARRRQTQGACSYCYAGTPVEKCLPPTLSSWFACATEPLLDLRLIEQACGCSTVRGSGGLKVRACFCRWHSGGECLPPGPSSCTCRWFGCCSGADLRLPLI